MERVAVVGSGVSGLAAAWLLASDSQKRFHVTLYEKNDYIGGHTHTVDYKPAGDPEAEPVPVDTGFIVFNELTYPNLLRFLDCLGVDHMKSDMSFAVSRDKGRFEWAGTDLGTVFAQRSNLISPRFWRTLLDIIRFNHLATDLLLPKHKDNVKGNSGSDSDNKDSNNNNNNNNPTSVDESISIGEYLERHGYSQSFAEDYLLPMTAAIWSTPADKCWTDFPAITLIRFMHNHCLLQIFDRPMWRTIGGGSRRYVDKVLPLIDDVRLSTAVVSIKRQQSRKQQPQKLQVKITDANGNQEWFDRVIVAAHGDEALKMLSDPTEAEQECLSRVKFTANRAVLHSDKRLMPLRESVWSSWNVLTEAPEHRAAAVAESKSKQVCLTYWMNRLQSIDTGKYGSIFVTMNPLFEPRPELVVAEYSYTHPLYTAGLIESQRLLKSVNSQAAGGKTNTVFCGAWANYGFHEDGLTSGLNAALLCGAKSPFPVQDSTHRRRLEAGPGWLQLAGEALGWIKRCCAGRPVQAIRSIDRQQIHAVLLTVLSLLLLTVLRWLDFMLVKVSVVRLRLNNVGVKQRTA